MPRSSNSTVADYSRMRCNGKRRSGEQMSALGHKRKWHSQIVMSALLPKADIPQRCLDVRFVPEADILLSSLMNLRPPRTPETYPISPHRFIRRRQQASQQATFFPRAAGSAKTHAPAIVQTNILPNAPAQLQQRLDEGRHAILSFRIVGGERCEYADAPDSLALLRTGCERPYRRSASNSFDEI